MDNNILITMSNASTTYQNKRLLHIQTTLVFPTRCNPLQYIHFWHSNATHLQHALSNLCRWIDSSKQQHLNKIHSYLKINGLKPNYIFSRTPVIRPDSLPPLLKIANFRRLEKFGSRFDQRFSYKDHIKPITSQVASKGKIF